MTRFAAGRPGGAAAASAAVARLARSLRARTPSEHLQYALARFHTVRRAYGAAMGVLRRPSAVAPETFVHVEPFSTHDAIAAVKRDAVFSPVRLRSDCVAAVTALARTQPCRFESSTRRFRFDEVSDGRLPDGAAAVIGYVDGVDRDPHVLAIANEPALRFVISHVLGHRSSRMNIRLMWSFVAEHAPELRRHLHQTIDYHFDVDAWNFVYANFYLTETDAASGAHVMIRGSHRAKPLRLLIGSAQRSDAAIERHYPPENRLVLSGAPGDGFVQDSSCFHKALIPASRPRLMLQIRYY